MLVLDAGAFIAAERGRKDVVALVKRERGRGRAPITNGSVVAQVWRGGGGKQATVARLLAGVEVVPVDDHLGRRAGLLLALSGASDAVDASVISPCSASNAATKSSIPRSLRSCSTFRRSASFTQALTDSASPAETAAWLAAIRSASTVTDSRVFAVIPTAYTDTTPMALILGEGMRGRAWMPAAPFWARTINSRYSRAPTIDGE